MCHSCGQSGPHDTTWFDTPLSPSASATRQDFADVLPVVLAGGEQHVPLAQPVELHTLEPPFQIFLEADPDRALRLHLEL